MNQWTRARAVAGVGAALLVVGGAAAAADAPETLPTPPGFTADQVSSGRRIYQAQPCAACHGPDAKGTALAPDLTTGTWLWGDGSVASISQTITEGVAQPKKFSSPMPEMGGAMLSDKDLNEVAAYLWAIGHKPK